MSHTRAALEAFLRPYTETNEATLDYHGLHGFLTALTICPLELNEKERNKHIFDQDVNLTVEQSKELNRLIQEVKIHIDRGFNDEEGFLLSCESEQEDDGDDALANWCIGFMVAHFLNEDAWFKSNEQEVCELLLPIMLTSELFNDEQEFKDIHKDEQLVEDMCSQIPEVLIELYLIFDAPEEKKPFKPNKRH